MRIGFTGTQLGMSESQGRLFTTLIKFMYIDIDEFHHGDCIDADATAHKIVRDYYSSFSDTQIIIHPPTEEKYRAFCSGYPNVTVLDPKPYLDRNKDIVDATDLLIACPRTHSEEIRSGTWSTIRYARKKGKPVIILV